MEEPEVITDPERESLIHEIADKIHAADDTSSSSVSDYEEKRPAPPSYVKPKSSRLFGRKKPVHKVFGGGKPADLMLWRNKNISAAVFGGATAIWVFFELLEYHLLTLACHISILALAMLFLWSNATILINKRAPHFPEVRLPEAPFVEVASALRNEINQALSMMREIASGRDLKKFLQVVFGLWILSIVGSFCNFVSLFYMLFVFLHTVPVLYENYEDKVETFLEKAMVELKKMYALFDSKVLSKIPVGPMKEKKRA